VLDLPCPRRGRIRDLPSKASPRPVGHAPLARCLEQARPFPCSGLLNNGIRQVPPGLSRLADRWRPISLRFSRKNAKSIARKRALEYCPTEGAAGGYRRLGGLSNGFDQRALAFSDEAERYGCPCPGGCCCGAQGTGKSH